VGSRGNFRHVTGRKCGKPSLSGKKAHLDRVSGGERSRKEPIMSDQGLKKGGPEKSSQLRSVEERDSTKRADRTKKALSYPGKKGECCAAKKGRGVLA